MGQLDEVAMLTAAVHERSRQSEAVAAVHEDFHGQVDRLFREMFLEAGLDEADAAKAAKSTMTLIEGIHLHEANRDAAGRDQLVLWTIDRIVAGSSG